MIICRIQFAVNMNSTYIRNTFKCSFTTDAIRTLLFFGNSHRLLLSKRHAERISCRKQLCLAKNKTDSPSELPAKQTY